VYSKGEQCLKFLSGLVHLSSEVESCKIHGATNLQETFTGSSMPLFLIDDFISYVYFAKANFTPFAVRMLLIVAQSPSSYERQNFSDR
jgi:hypothetical protein